MRRSRTSSVFLALSLAALGACSRDATLPVVLSDDAPTGVAAREVAAADAARPSVEDPGRDFPTIAELCADPSLNPTARELTPTEIERLEEVRFAYGVQMREVSRERGKVEREIVRRRVAAGEFERLVEGEALQHRDGVVSVFVATDAGGLPAVVKLRPADLPGWDRWTQLRETIQLEARAEFRNVFEGAF